MGNWIFQGNPKQFDVDTYIEKNEIVNWNIRQKQFLDEVQVGDKVLFGDRMVAIKTLEVLLPFVKLYPSHTKMMKTIKTVKIGKLLVIRM